MQSRPKLRHISDITCPRADRLVNTQADSLRCSIHNHRQRAKIERYLPCQKHNIIFLCSFRLLSIASNPLWRFCQVIHKSFNKLAHSHPVIRAFNVESGLPGNPGITSGQSPAAADLFMIFLINNKDQLLRMRRRGYLAGAIKSQQPLRCCS